MDYKIFSYLDKLIDAYKEPVSLLDGLSFDFKDTLRTIEFYSNDQYVSGSKDSLGRDKPFYNVCNYRVTVAKTATDLDVKDIKYEPDSLNDSIPAMLINHELYKYLKESNFSETLNDMGFTRPKYGELLLKKHEYDGELDIDVVAWKNVDVDPVDITRNIIVETHYMLPSELLQKSDVWDSKEIREAIKAHAKANKNKPSRIELKEVTGEFSYSFDPDEKETEENDMKFKSMCFYIVCVNKKKFLVYKEDIKSVKDKYRSLSWEKIPGRPGRGIVESGFQSQMWTNDSMITMKNAMELYSKLLIYTDSNKVNGNAVTGMDHGHIIHLEKQASIGVMNMGASKMPELQNVVSLWDTQYSKISSTYDANTGEAPTAGTPYSQTALLNQVANSPFEYQREVWGIFLNEILNDWILPHLKKRIKKAHYLVSEFSEDELALIDEAIQNKEGNEIKKQRLLEGEIPTEEEMAGVEAGVTKALGSLGTKREIEIPDGFLDVDGKITANITGELRNKQAILQSLAQIGRDIMATFNPNTGTYAAMEDPFLRNLYGSIIDMSGVPMTSAQLKSAPVQQQDLSAVASEQPVIA